MFSATVRTTCTVLSPAGAGGPGRSRRSPVTSRQRTRSDRATSATAGPRSRVPTSCQPRRRRARCALESKRSPASSVRSMPLTKASSPSMHDRLLVVAVERVLARVHLAADARAARERAHGLADLRARRMEGRHRRPGPHEHAHVDALGQLGQQRADDDRRLALDELEVRREVPAGDVDEVARVLHASAIAGSACAPSTRTSSEQPSRGGGSPAAHRPSSGGSSARSQPRRRRRRRCLSVTAASIVLPIGGVGVAQEGNRHGSVILPALPRLNISDARGAARPGIEEREWAAARPLAVVLGRPRPAGRYLARCRSSERRVVSLSGYRPTNSLSSSE